MILIIQSLNFNHNGLRITIEAHKQIIIFLDVTFNLNKSTYRSFTNPNTTLQYVHCKSINPPITTKNIPAGTNKRLSSLSSNKAFFDQTAPTYQKALNKCGYQYTLFLRKNRNTDFLYIYIYIYIYRERERERERKSVYRFFRLQCSIRWIRARYMLR